MSCMVCASPEFVSPKLMLATIKPRPFRKSASRIRGVYPGSQNELNLLSTFHQVTDILTVLPAFIATQTINLSSDQTRLRSSAFLRHY
ncbi:MAG: hypothetical protein IPJ51_19940 [Saprospiraceae bacterium]|nr:hypothetical protein [Saprospiraceae bacterium]